MKVLLVSFETFLTAGAGLATYTKHAVNAHLAAGHEVHLLTSALWNDYRKPGFAAPGFTATILTPKELNRYYVRVNAHMRAPEATALSDAAEKIAREWGADVVEGTDYLFPLQPLSARKRAGLLGEGFPPIVVVNHGMHRDFTPVAAVLPPEASLRTMAAEEQAVLWADGAIVPSQAAYENIARLRGSREGLFLIREPFSAKGTCGGTLNAGAFLHFGRLTFAKGIDRYAYLMNTLYGFHELERILFIGTEADTAFPKKSVRAYFKKKLHPDLYRLLHFYGPQEPDEARILLSQAGFHANLSRSETFSYATLESLFAGVLPLVEAGTPMAEFLPAEMRPGLLTQHALHDGGLPRVMEFWTSGDYAARIRAIQEYAGEMVAPARFARDYENMVDALRRPPRKKARVSVEPPYTSRDVTVLISCHNDAELLTTALRSIAAQTQPVAETIIFDDGSDNPKHLEHMKLVEKLPGVTVMHSTNLGLVAARRRLIDQARTRLVVFLDADDYLEDEYVERTLAALNHQPDCAAVLTHRVNFGLNNDVSTDFLMGTPYHWLMNDFRMTALLKADAARTIGFDPEVKNGEADDWVFWLRFTVRGFRALFCPLPLFRYRTALGSMSWPWSEGHAATTLYELSRVVDQARVEGYDLGDAAKVLMLGAMRRSWDLALAEKGEGAIQSDLAKELRSDLWLLLGSLIGQAGPLRESLIDPKSDMEKIVKHLRESRWMKIGRMLRLSHRLPEEKAEPEI